MNIEYLSMDKIMSVPGDATALRRKPFSFVLSIVRWTENTPENLKAGKKACHDLANVVSNGNGDLTEADGVNFSNYGRSDHSRMECSELTIGISPRSRDSSSGGQRQ
jgi:hypothetical protein